MIVEQVFDNATHEGVPSNPSKSALVFPLENQYCIFDGRLGHGKLSPSASRCHVHTTFAKSYVGLG